MVSIGRNPVPARPLWGYHFCQFNLGSPPHSRMKQVPSGPQPLQIRAMQAHELARHIDWAAQEGWNPGLHDAQAFHGADPQGFLLAELAG